jgi:hypothetical protein
MNQSPLSYDLARDRQRELLAQALRARGPQPSVRRVAAAAVRPGRERRGALRKALLEACGLPAGERP